MKNKSLVTTGNSLSGIVGGGLGGMILQMLGIGAQGGGSMDLTSILGSVASSGVVLIIVAVLRKALAKR